MVITPLLDPTAAFDADSVDVRLGQTFLLPKSLQQPYFCPDSKSHDTLYVEVFVPFGRYLVVPAHQTVLGATLEFIKLPSDLCAEILTKSSIARTFVVIETAPWVHPDYRGCLTLEIANVSNTPVLLYPGRKIGQLIFMHLDSDRTALDAAVPSSPKEKLNSTYFGPVYPEGPKFKNPEDDLLDIGITDTWRIAEVEPDIAEKTKAFGQSSTSSKHQKLDEIRSYIDMNRDRMALLGVPDYQVRAIIESISVVSPEYDDVPPTPLVTAVVDQPNIVYGAGEIVRGMCTKPGNIRLGLGTLAKLGPSAYQSIHAHSVVGMLQLAWALWEIASKRTIDLTLRQVIVFRAMWELGGGERPLTQDEILQRCGADFASHDLGALTMADLESILSELETIRCIRFNDTTRCWSVAEEIAYEYR